jgi:gliding motility-associated-like protein
MKRILSFKNLLCFLIAAASISQSKAQITITTNFTNNPTTTTFTAGGTGNIYITFTVRNNNASYPITITDVGKRHIGLIGTNSENGAKYSLWYSPNNVIGSPIPIIPANGWNFVKTSDPISNGVNNDILPILTGLSITIPPSTTYRFLVATSLAEIGGRLSGSPTSFTTGGVTLETTIDQYVGVIPNVAANLNQSYDGFVTFVRAAPGAPTVTADDNTLCAGDSLVLNAVPPSYVANPTITWYGPGGTTPIGNGPRLVLYNVTAAQAGQYSATIQDDANISAPGIVNVTITETPVPAIVGRTAYCLNDQFEPLTVIGSNITWFTVPTGGVGNNIPPYINTSIAGSYTFFASQTVNGCESPRAPVTITAAPKPPAPGVASQIGYCENAVSVPLTANGQNLKWYVNNVTPIGSVFAPTPNTSSQDTLTYFVSQTVDGCEGPRAKIDVIITERPNGLIFSSKEQLCMKDTLTLSYYGKGTTESSAFSWTIPDGATLLSGSQAGPLVVRLDRPGNYKFELQVKNFECPSGVWYQNVQVDPIPDASIASKERFCLNATEQIFLYSYTPTVDTFLWDFGGGDLSNFSQDQGPFGVSYNTPGQKIVTLTIADEKCRNTITDTIEVLPLPDAKFSIDGISDGMTACNGDSLRFEARTIEPASKYEWSPVRFFGNYLNNPVTIGTVEYGTAIKLKVTDEYGCVNTDSIRVRTKPCCEMALPTGFTPNGDGRNDIFRILTSGNHGMKTFRIMNRWGQTVFETVDEKRGWDGTFNGTPLDAGTYYYYIAYKCDGQPAEQKGEITLIR